MHSKYKIIIVVLSLLLILSLGISVISYKISLDSTHKQLISQSLPLSVDNIYTEIQKKIIEPHLVSSMMASNTFLHEWLLNDEDSVLKIQRYLESIKNEYHVLGAFLVSDRTKNYYTHKGFVEQVKKTIKRNQWYFDFKDSTKNSEINIDLNKYLNDSLIMFINFKIFDDDFHYLGTTGVAIEISYIKKMLKHFKKKYKLTVNFLDAEGNYVLLNETDNKVLLSTFKDKILSAKSYLVEYEKDGSTYILNSKYIQELDAYLLVEAKVDDFTKETKEAFYLNIVFSLFLALIIATILINIIRNYNKKLETLSQIDALTNIPNRRNFHDKFEYLNNLRQRSSEHLCLLFIDIDDFKKINDEFGHGYGDIVLQEFAKILQASVRKSDLFARWGGEEFIVALANTPIKEAKDLAEKIRSATTQSQKIQELLSKPVTISLGLTLFKEDDTLDTVIARADKAMYQAKTSGKNRVCIL